MRSEHIDELLYNIQIVKEKATEAIDFLRDKENLDFEEIKEVYGKLEIITGRTVTSNVFIEMNIASHCIECGGENVVIDWDEGMVECQNVNCKFKWSIKTSFD